MDGTPLPDVDVAKPAKEMLSVLLSGLEAGMMGVLWMLAWLGLSSLGQQRSFWTPENLFATAFYGGGAIRPGFAHTTFAGLALYLLVYSLLGAVFAMVVGNRVSRGWAMLAAVLFGLVWYFVSFRGIWKSAIPLAFLLHSEQPTILGHLIYGTFLGRFQVYLEDPPAAGPPAPSQPTAIQGVEAVPPETTPTDMTAELPATAAPLPSETPDTDPDLPATPTPAQSSSPPDQV